MRARGCRSTRIEEREGRTSERRSSRKSERKNRERNLDRGRAVSRERSDKAKCEMKL